MSMPSLDSSHLSPDNSTKARPKGSDGQGAQIPQTKTPSNHGGNKSNSLVGSPEGNCVDTPNRCIEKKKMIACLKQSEDRSLELFLLVQNDGEDALKTNIIVPASIDIPVEQLGIPKHQTRKFKISVSTEESLKIVFNAGNGQCVLHMGSSVSDGFFSENPCLCQPRDTHLWLPSSQRGGMTVLGKVAVPKPINLHSQRLENHGVDPNVEIVPKM